MTKVLYLFLIHESKHSSSDLCSKDYQKASKELQNRREAYYCLIYIYIYIYINLFICIYILYVYIYIYIYIYIYSWSFMIVLSVSE